MRLLRKNNYFEMLTFYLTSETITYEIITVIKERITYTNSRKCPETSRIGTPYDFIYGGAKLRIFIYGGGAKLRIFIYVGCQDYREKIDFLPSAAGARKKIF